jgi:hypothetical protein
VKDSFTSAAARARASLIPSPTITTLPPLPNDREQKEGSIRKPFLHLLPPPYPPLPLAVLLVFLLPFLLPPSFPLFSLFKDLAVEHAREDSSLCEASHLEVLQHKPTRDETSEYKTQSTNREKERKRHFLSYFIDSKFLCDWRCNFFTITFRKEKRIR